MTTEKPEETQPPEEPKEVNIDEDGVTESDRSVHSSLLNRHNVILDKLHEVFVWATQEYDLTIVEALGLVSILHADLKDYFDMHKMGV